MWRLPAFAGLARGVPARVISATMLSVCVFNPAAAQPLMPPHMGPALPDWLIGGLIGFFVGAGICAVLAKIGEAIDNAAGRKKWSSVLAGMFGLLGFAAWLATIWFLAVEL